MTLDIKPRSVYDYIKLIGIALLMLLIVVSIIWLIVVWQKAKKEAAINLKRAIWAETAPVKRDTIWKDTIYYVEKIKWKEPKAIVQTVTNDTCLDLPENFYQDTYQEDGLRLRYEAYTTGWLNKFRIVDYVCAKEIQYITRVVDTCKYKVPAYRPMNHWGASVTLSGNSFSKFPNPYVGLFYSFKDYVAIRAGVEYNAYHGEVYGRIGLDLYLSKKPK